MALRIVSIFRMVATMATLWGFPQGPQALVEGLGYGVVLEWRLSRH